MPSKVLCAISWAAQSQLRGKKGRAGVGWGGGDTGPESAQLVHTGGQLIRDPHEVDEGGSEHRPEVRRGGSPENRVPSGSGPPARGVGQMRFRVL